MQSGNNLEMFAEGSQQLTRRRLLEHMAGAVVVGSALPWLVGCNSESKQVAPVATLYPSLSGQFGDVVPVSVKVDFPAATPDRFKLNSVGVFYHQLARTYIVHLAKETNYLLTGMLLGFQLAIEAFTPDHDGSYWLALYQKCVHLGTKVAFRDDCLHFKCPSHGAQYHCDGEYLNGPAPRRYGPFPPFAPGRECAGRYEQDYQFGSASR